LKPGDQVTFTDLDASQSNKRRLAKYVKRIKEGNGVVVPSVSKFNSHSSGKSRSNTSKSNTSKSESNYHYNNSNANSSNANSSNASQSHGNNAAIANQLGQSSQSGQLGQSSSAPKKRSSNTNQPAQAARYAKGPDSSKGFSRPKKKTGPDTHTKSPNTNSFAALSEAD